MKHELSAHEMRHQFSISQAHISGHKQTKMSHCKLSGKSETESSLHQADFLRVRYWPVPARVSQEGQAVRIHTLTPSALPCYPVNALTLELATAGCARTLSNTKIIFLIHIYGTPFPKVSIHHNYFLQVSLLKIAAYLFSFLTEQSNWPRLW